jgi:hypothetical protein
MAGISSPVIELRLDSMPLMKLRAKKYPNQLIQDFLANEPEPGAFHDEAPIPIKIESLALQVTLLASEGLVLATRYLAMMRQNKRLDEHIIPIDPNRLQWKLLPGWMPWTKRIKRLQTIAVEIHSDGLTARLR